MTTPGSTYRLQLHAGFTFEDAARIVPYLDDLGVTHLYLSPSLRSAPGSTHGYDVVDPTSLDVERGGEDGFSVLRAAIEQAGLGIVLDIVPNHLGLVLPDNRWWWDVLRQGPDSPWAGHFDIDWATGPTGRAQLVWPVLGDPLADVLAAGELGASVLDGQLVLTYDEHSLPTRPGTAADHGLAQDPTGAASTLAADPTLLRRVLDDQHYRLVHWTRANTEIVHRRFFDITTLGGVRVERPAVFDDVHRRVLDLVTDGVVDGLRVDHPDGLWDPTGYAHDLHAAAPGCWIVFEKILEQDEEPRRDWPVDGTVGYAFCNAVLHTLVDGRAEPALTALYDELTGERQDPVAITDAAKREALTLFDAELDRLTALVVTIAAEDRGSSPDGAADPSSWSRARRVLAELVVAFPVYRTYVVPARDEITDQDHAVLDQAVATARVHVGADPLLDLVDDVLRLRRRGGATAELVHRFQQLTGPVTAKGLEDTTFYRYLRFVAANEVGGHPAHLGWSVERLHASNARRQRQRPTTMLTTSTHDTKRAEDVRARLAVLSEVPDLWVRTVQRLEAAGRRHQGRTGPSAAHRYLVWQTLVGAWPIGADRLVDHMVKAAREGKQQTSWLAADEDYEDDLERFVRGVREDHGVEDALAPLLEVVVPAGRIASITQAVLRLTSPGVPDTYQGSEVWDLSLVDPDNRRPVDHAANARLLAWLDEAERSPAEVLRRMDEGAPKLFAVSRALRLRRERPAAFGADGSYEPITVVGARADHVVAHLRGGAVATVVPRWATGLGGGAVDDWSWGDTAIRLPAGRWHDRLTGAVTVGGAACPVAEVLASFPAALLVREDDR